MTTAGERTSNFKAVFRRFVGRPGSGRPWTVKTLAETTGITDRTMQSYNDVTGSEPCWEKMLRLFDALGPTFVNALLAPIGMGGVHLVEDAEFSAANMIAQMAEELAVLARAHTDGIIDHQESAELAPRLKDLGTRLIEASAAIENGNIKQLRAVREGG